MGRAEHGEFECWRKGYGGVKHQGASVANRVIVAQLLSCLLAIEYPLGQDCYRAAELRAREQPTRTVDFQRPPGPPTAPPMPGRHGG